MREWLMAAPNKQLKAIQISAGDALVNYQIKNWMMTGQCQLQSAAASGVITDIQSMPQWLNVRTTLQPQKIPDDIETAEKNVHVELLLRITEHFRSSILPNQMDE